jgi:hypothetical protein
MGIRETIVEDALASVGLGAARNNGEPYADLIAHGESAQAQRDMIRESGCGLVVRALWRRAFGGYSYTSPCDPRLRAPYKTGSVMTTIRDMADEAHAWRGAELVSGGEYAPEPGDVFWLEGPEHVATLTRIVASEAPDFDYKWSSVDGGQRDTGGAELIQNRVRVCRMDAHNVLTLDGRTLRGVVDLEALAATFGASA